MTEHHCWRCGNCDADDELRLCDDCRESYLRVHAVPEPLTDVERAVLARDVADVQHALDDDDEDRRLSKWEASVCEAWLTRARAALA